MNPPGLASTNLNGVRKAAVLLVLLGEEAATTVYRHLSQAQLQRLTKEIGQVNGVDPDTAAQVLEEYYRLSLTQDYLSQGGDEYARALLVKAFGGDGAKALLEQVSRAQDLSATQLDALQKADPQELARFLEDEQPQTIALILAYLDAQAASAVLMKLPETVRIESVKRLARLRNFSPEMAQKVSTVLHKRLQPAGEQSRRDYAGFKSAADLMNRLEPGAMKAVLDAIESDDAKLALNIRNLMFTFDDLLGVPENGIRELVAQAGQEGADPGPEGRLRGAAQPSDEGNFLARLRDVEGRHGSDGAGARPRRQQGTAGSRGGGAPSWKRKARSCLNRRLVMSTSSERCGDLAFPNRVKNFHYPVIQPPMFRPLTGADGEGAGRKAREAAMQQELAAAVETAREQGFRQGEAQARAAAAQSLNETATGPGRRR